MCSAPFLPSSLAYPSFSKTRIMFSANTSISRSAHNRPVLLNIVRTSGANGIVHILSTDVTGYLQLLGLLNAKNKFILKNVRMHDLFCLIMLHHEYIKNPIVKSIRKQELIRLLNRAQDSKNLYKNHSTVREIYNFFGAVAKSL